MPLDPKYANLPWIATDSKDVYESADLPESDQIASRLNALHASGDNSLNVTTFNIAAEEAKRRFQGKTLTTDQVDFSDRILPHTRLGYTSGKEKFEYVSDFEKSKETPLETYQRLQTELDLFHRQLKEAVAESVGSEKNANDNQINMGQINDLSLSCRELMKQLNLLSEVRQSSIRNDATGSVMGLQLSDTSALEHQKLLAKIGAVQQKPESSSKSSGDKPAGDNDKCVYQLYQQSDMKKAAITTKYSELEQRMERLEGLLGNEPTKLSCLTADTLNHGLLEGVSKICARSALLDPSHLEVVEARLNALHHKLQTVTEKKDAIANADTQNKIAELYGLVKKWDGVATGLPDLVNRLQGLKALHEQAVQFSQTLNAMDKNQKQLEITLKEDDAILKEVKNNLETSVEQINSLAATFKVTK